MRDCGDCPTSLRLLMNQCQCRPNHGIDESSNPSALRDVALGTVRAEGFDKKDFSKAVRDGFGAGASIADLGYDPVQSATQPP